MLIALDRNETPLGQLVTVKNAEIRERLSGESLLSFEMPNVREQVALLMLDGYIKCDGQLFVIKTIEEQTSGRNYISVQAVHVYVELVEEYIDRTVDLLGAMAAQALTAALLGSPFSVGSVNVTGLRDIDISERSALKAVQEIREKWDCDLWFDNRTVHLGKKGQDKADEIRYGSNLKALRKPATTTNVITRLYVYGRDGLTFEAINGGKKYLDSPNIGLYRRPKCGEVRFNDITTPQELMQEGQRYLLTKDKVNVSYSVDYADLGERPIELGDAVTITHMPFEMQTMGTRVVERSYDPLQRRIRSVVLSSYLETTVDDMVAIRKKQYYLERATAGRASELQQQQNAAKAEMNDILDSLGELDGYIDGAFQDGLISAAEAKAIESHIVRLIAEKADIDAKYTEVYGNPSLSGSPKTTLASTKQQYNSAHSNLISSINAAIADGKTTAAEKADVDIKFADYRAKMAALSAAFETAISSIVSASSTAAQQAAELVAKAEADLAEVQAKAYADGKVTAEEQARIEQAAQVLANAKADATTKMNAAKADAATAATAAAAAQTTANTAKTGAETANSLLADYSNDNKLNPLEKQATKLEWDSIVVERPNIEDQATLYGITTEKSLYLTAYVALNTYINPLLADLTTTSNIVGDTFRSNFNTYYSRRSALLKVIADKAKQRSDLAEANAKSYADISYGDTKIKVDNGKLHIVDKNGQVIAGENGLDLENIAGYGVETGGIIRVENVAPATYETYSVTISRSDLETNKTINFGDTSALPYSMTTNYTYFMYFPSNTVRLGDGTYMYAAWYMAYVTWTGKTADSLTGVKVVPVSNSSATAIDVSAGQFLFKTITETTADIVVSNMVVVMPNKKRYVIPETRINRNVFVPQTDFDGWKFLYIWVNENGAIQMADGGTSGGFTVYPPNPPAGSIRLGYLLCGYGAEDPSGTLTSSKKYENGLPAYIQRVYHDTRYRDERAVRADGGEALLGGTPYGAQTINLNLSGGEYKTVYLPVGKGRRSVNVSLTLDDGSGYDNYNYGAQLVVGRKAANNADGKGRPLWANYTDADGQRGHVSGQRNTPSYGIHVLSPRVWGRSCILLYDADLTPDPSNAAVIALKLTFYNYTGSSESVNIKVNWHAF